MLNDLANQGAVSSGLLGSPYGNNPLGAQGMSQADMQRMQSAQMNMAQNSLYPGGIVGPSTISGAWPPFHKAPRLQLEVDKVTNGFVLKCKNELLIAKDLEELQGLFVAQVAAMLLEDK